jgi:DHA1 family multidrug resistance protein-like MFS transporter
MLFILWFLPESLRATARQGSSIVLRPSAQITRLWRALFSPIGILLFMAFLVSPGLTNSQSIFGLYALENFGYDTKQVGSILMAAAIVSTITQGALTGPLTKRWGEANLIKATLLASSITFLTLLLADSFLTVLLTTCLFEFPNALLRPAVISLTSKHSTEGQGIAMGLNNSFKSLGRIVGPVWAGFAFDFNCNIPYLSGAVILFVSFLISLAWVTQESVKPAGARRPASYADPLTQPSEAGKGQGS